MKTRRCFNHSASSTNIPKSEGEQENESKSSSKQSS